MAGVVADGKAGVILMHSRGTVSDMATYDHANYGEDVVGDILEELGEALERARMRATISGSSTNCPPSRFWDARSWQVRRGRGFWVR
jgi:hypothetical protein